MPVTRWQSRSPGGQRPQLWTEQEDVEFAALFSIAWDLRGTKALRPVLETIEAWHADRMWRRAQVYLAHRAAADAETDRHIELLRETDPARIGTKEKAGR
jgi:hypothetical protein